MTVGSRPSKSSMPPMKTLLLFLCLLVGGLHAQSAGVPTELLLKDGSKLKGRVMTATAAEVTVMTDFGVLRIALDKLTPESAAQVAAGHKPDVDALLRRVSELEARVAQLQQENDTLRRQAAVSPPSTYRPSGAQSLTPSQPAPPAGRSSTTISSTGKRHNSGCRYYAGGRACGPNDGIACKICGG
jgi:uncharacterized small protein (DUF1192 family)